MTLKAGKEMDKHCVLNWLNEVYVTPSRAFDEYTEDELKMFAHDALVLLHDKEYADQPNITVGNLNNTYGSFNCSQPKSRDEDAG